MLFAWYGHLKYGYNKPLLFVIAISWLLAFFEYAFQVPANRIGFETGAFSLMQLKVLQEIITLGVFIPFSLYFMKQPVNWNFLFAGICLVGAAFFVFR